MALSKKAKIEINADIQSLAQKLRGAKEQIEETASEMETINERSSETDIDIGASPDPDEIEKGVAQSKVLANYAMASTPQVNVPIGAESSDSLGEDIEFFKAIAELADDAREGKEAVKDANDDMAESADRGGDKLNIETDSMSKLVEEADTLEEAKYAVRNANREMSDSAEDGGASLIREGEFAAMTSKEQDKLAEALEESASSNRNLSRSVRRARSNLDEMNDSMRAASEVGDLFEDGLGSLSLNVGAFTIALRNFLTQVPLILTGLGAIAAAAVGAAAAFGTLAFSIAALLGVGLIAHLQQVRDSFGGVKDIGQAMQVVMRNMLDLFERAVEPLLEMEGNIDLFVDMASGIATFVNKLSLAVAELTRGSDAIDEYIEQTKGMQEGFFSIQDAIDSFDGGSMSDIIGALKESWVLLGRETVGALDGIGAALADIIRRSAKLLRTVNDLGDSVSQFSNTISSLAEVGFTIGGGLLPVFESFASIVERVADFIAQLDSEMVQNAITLGALFLVFDRVFGVIGSFVNILPALAVGFNSVTAKAANASTSIGVFSTGLKAAASSIVGFIASATPLLKGSDKLAENLTTLSESTRRVAFSNREAGLAFINLARAVKESDRDLEELGHEMTETTGRTVVLSENVDELAEDLRELAVSGHLADSQIDDIARSSSKANGSMATLNAMVPTLSTLITRLGLSASGSSTGLSVLGVSISSLATLLAAVIPVVVALTTVIGALAVGAIKNADKLKSSFESAISVISTVIGELVDLILTVFVATWDAMRMAVDPIIAIFESFIGTMDMVSGSTGESANRMEIFTAIIDATEEAVAFLIRTLGMFVKAVMFVGTIFGRVMAVGVGAFIGGIIKLVNLLSVLSAEFFGAGDDVQNFGDLLIKVFEMIEAAIRHFSLSLEKSINDSISIVNQAIEEMNEELGLDIQTLGKVTLARDEEDPLGAQDDMTQEPDKQITYNEDNSTNIEQTVNADPEDQAQLSRVVTDAINEANSFQRRRQGGQ